MEFLYNDYRQIIEKLLNKGYKPVGYEEAGSFSKEVILRHDVDVSPEKALIFAQLEASWGVKSTYYFLTTSKLYNVCNKETIEIIKRIAKLGHYIGLHFDETQYDVPEDEEIRDDFLKTLIIKEKNLLENLFEDITIDSVSMHIPSRKTLESDLQFGDGFINSYGQTFFKGYKYLSDSEMRWRENVNDIIDKGEYSKLHILTHPIWYDDVVLTKENKVLKYLTVQKTNIHNEIKTIVPGIEKSIKIEDF